MILEKVLQGVSVRKELPEDLRSISITGLEYDSRRVEPGYLFFAFAGSRTDGREFAQPAMAKGAVAVVSELPAPVGFRGPWIEVERGRRALALASRNFYNRPDERLGLTGVTGTNGKTMTSSLIDTGLRAAGKTTALVGTIEYRVASEVRTAVNTTPESLDLYRIFHDLERVGGTHATMGVSSHALALDLADGIQFHTAVFTNLTRDHLDFHGDMDSYFAAKQMLFTPEGAPAPAWAVINYDDPRGKDIRIAPGTQVLRYGFGEGADLHGSELEMDFGGVRFTVKHQDRKLRIHSALVGKINAYNILAACGAAVSYGFDWETIANGIAEWPHLPGPLQRLSEGQPFLVVVDYAHTDD